MLAISILSVFLVSSNAIALAPTGCNGADPAIVSVAVKNVSQNGPINVYHLAGTVTNVGNRNQTSNVLQFVNIYVNDEDVRYLKGLETPVEEGDVISILPAVAGG